jgi:1-acyl-sn-glycerol-3-phosphate acyltransferase
MEDFERALNRLEPRLQRWLSLLLLGKKLEVRGVQNFVKEGPNIIIGNHCGAFKDVAVLIRIRPRMVYFTANRLIFSREGLDFLIQRHFRRHLKDVGPLLNSLLGPPKARLIDFVSGSVAKVGTIPVALEYGKREAMEFCEDYLRKGRAIIMLQGRGRVHPDAPHPYISGFKRGAAILAYVLCKEHGTVVPVTPLAIFGTHKPWVTPGTIKVSVGAPLDILPYMSDDFDDSVDRFRRALEERVKALFLGLIAA